MSTLQGLSIIIPIFNGERFIDDAVRSIFSQSYLPPTFEILLIDDGSSDGSLAICTSIKNEFKQVKIIALNENQGVAKARNIGVQSATYEHLCFLDQDDTWAPEKLALQAKSMEDHPEIDYFLGLQSFSLFSIESYPRWFNESWGKNPQKGYVFGSMLIKKKTFLEVGLLNESYKYGIDDVDWFARAKDMGKIELVQPHVFLHRKIHTNNASSRTQHANIELLRVIKEKLDRTNGP